MLTAENCPELAAILETKNESDPAIAAFAKEYAGRTIEFDGCVTSRLSNGGKYDFLINAGDFDPDSASGPNFKFEKCGKSDLGMSSSASLPSVGDNVHVIAVVGKHNADTTIFLLKPVSVESR